MNNNKFSFPRFRRYAKAEIYANRKLWGTLLASFTGLVLIIFMIPIVFDQTIIETSTNVETGVTARIFFAFGGSAQEAIGLSYLLILFFVNSIFKSFRQRGIASQSVTLPVSLAEKFLFGAIASLCFIFIITGIVELISALFTSPYWNEIPYHPAIIWYSTGGFIVGFEPLPFLEFIYMNLPMFALLIAVYFFGSIHWRSKNLIKTTGCLIGFYTLFIITIQVLLVQNGYKFTGIFTVEPWILSTLIWLLTVGVVILSWVRFKRLQIKK